MQAKNYAASQYARLSNDLSPRSCSLAERQLAMAELSSLCAQGSELDPGGFPVVSEPQEGIATPDPDPPEEEHEEDPNAPPVVDGGAEVPGAAPTAEGGAG